MTPGVTYRDTESDIESDAGLKRAVTEDRVWTWVETVKGVMTQEVTVRFDDVPSCWDFLIGRHGCLSTASYPWYRVKRDAACRHGNW